ncbi:ABC transporter permease [Lachnospiraceae bacterium oral taxon 500]|nr:ABC transporter permease [Lachnospiraceae bacterium oral taxon 500]
MQKETVLKTILNSLIPIIAAFILGGIVILLLGENPLTTYGILISKSLFTGKGILNTLHYAAPMILTGLAIAVTFKANIYNMGVEGQMLLGGFFAGIVGAYFPMENSVLSKLLCFAVAILCGMLFALIPALLKAKCGVNEMVVTLMLNYAVAKSLEFLTTGVFRDKAAGYVATPLIGEGAMFHRLGNFRITLFFGIALLLLLLMIVVMQYSKLGYEIRAIGKNSEFAEATGMNVGKKIIILMLISGALSGIAGAGWMLSDQFKYTLSFSENPGLGWDGMLIALLGGHSPLGILFAAVFYAALKTGSDSINMYTSVPKEIIEIIQAIIILFLAVKFIGEKVKLFSANRKGGRAK